MYCLTRECYKPPPASLPTFFKRWNIISHVMHILGMFIKAVFIRHSVALMELIIILANQILFLLTSLIFFFYLDVSTWLIFLFSTTILVIFTWSIIVPFNWCWLL